MIDPIGDALNRLGLGDDDDAPVAPKPSKNGHKPKPAAEPEHGDAWEGPAEEPEPPRTEEEPVTEADDDPHRLARILVEQYRHPEGYMLLRYYREGYVTYTGSAWQNESEDDLRARVTATIKDDFDRLNREATEHWLLNGKCDDNGNATPAPVARKVSTRLVTDVMQALDSLTLLPARTEQPSWIGWDDPPCAAGDVLACPTVLVDLPRAAGGLKCTYPATPQFFSPIALSYDYCPHAPTPAAWLEFMHKLWPDDPETIATLQEWLGYLLTTDTSQQKILLLVGPLRSGKGTIARVLNRLIGQQNICAPTLASLGTNFGIEGLLDKSAAIISDARLSGRTDGTVVVERLLSISGEDTQSIDRKYRSILHTKLGVRFMILTNELPKLSDPSGALVGRFIVLRMLRSWFGQEDVRLTAKLLTELPGVLNWAIEGWKRLRERGRFLQPESGRRMIDELQDLASPIGAFLRDCCLVGPEHEVFVKDLFARWQRWCTAKGREHPGTEQVFGRDLRAAVPMLDMRQSRTGESRMRKYVGVGLRPDDDELNIPD